MDSEQNILPTDYDRHWKDIIAARFEDFVKFFLPDVYPQVDFAQPVVFLEQELKKFIADKRYGFKKKLIALAAEKQYDRYKIAALLRFIYLIITLPESFEVKIKVKFVKLLTKDESNKAIWN